MYNHCMLYTSPFMCLMRCVSDGLLALCCSGVSLVVPFAASWHQIYLMPGDTQEISMSPAVRIVETNLSRTRSYDLEISRIVAPAFDYQAAPMHSSMRRRLCHRRAAAFPWDLSAAAAPPRYVSFKPIERGLMSQPMRKAWKRQFTRRRGEINVLSPPSPVPPTNQTPARSKASESKCRPPSSEKKRRRLRHPPPSP